MKINIKCPVCNNEKVLKFLKFKEFSIYSCNSCRMKFAYPVPTKKELLKFYENDYFEGGKEGVSGYKDYQSLEKDLKKEADKKIGFIKNYVRWGQFLDLGAGTGIFAQIAKNNGFEVFVNDISKFAQKNLKKRGIEGYYGAITKDIFPKDKFDALTAWDTIEHVPDVLEFIEAVKKSLKKGGYLFLTTPDTGSWDARMMGKNWYGYKKIPEHLLFFDETSISRLLNNNGFEVVKITNWGFYRSIGFMLDKMQSYSSAFSFLGNLASGLKISDLSLFFPMTDFMVVARKK